MGLIAFGILSTLVGSWFFVHGRTLLEASSSPVDAYLMLGGSIRREIHVAEVARSHPDIPILISQGSPDPCIFLIFQRVSAPLANVWLEKCARSTFDNFHYSWPILQRWGVRKVKLVTSASHLPRALWLSKVMLGSHGIWVELDTVKEQGRPGNRESVLKTSLDLTRAFGWAIVSQFRKSSCSEVIPLAEVNLPQWQQRGFACEHQGNLQ